MYKVLIIDDEILAIQFLENLIDWNSLDCKVVGTAITVRKALMLVQEIQPDIIFMDIKMPGIDGLVLSQKIRQENSHMEIIILTAYADFEFAQKALKIGVSDFLIKHELSTKLLQDTIYRAIDRIENKKQISNLIVERWMKENWEGKEIVHTPQELQNMKGTFRVLMIKKESIFSTLEEEAAVSKSEEYVEEPYVIGRISQKTDWIVFIIGIQDIWSENKKRELFVQTGYRLLENCQIECIGPLIGIYSAEFMGLGDFGIACEQLKKMQNLRFFQPHHIIFSEEYKTLEVVSPKWPPEPVERLREALFEGRKKTEEFLQNVFRPTAEDFLVEDRELWVARELMRTYMEELPLYIRHLRSVSDIGKYGSRIGEYLKEKQAKESGLDFRVQQAIDYISRHYQEDINSEMIADYLQVSEGYLRKLFRQETGETLKEYILSYRMKKAKQYLASGKYRISEIAHMCGYKTSQHFSTAFKNIVGMSPGVYSSENHNKD